MSQNRTFTKEPIENAILTEMWRLNNLLANNIPLRKEETKFYNLNIAKMQGYYAVRSVYWEHRKKIK